MPITHLEQFLIITVVREAVSAWYMEGLGFRAGGGGGGVPEPGAKG